MRWTPVLALAMAFGCHKPEDPAARAERDRERAAAEALRKETEILLEKAKSLTLIRWDPIDDGGSHVFWFRTDSGAPLQLLMLHNRKDKRGNTRYQEFRMLGQKSNAECEVERGSALEKHLVDLLTGCRLDAAGGPPWKPTAETAPWLQTRLLDRTIPFDSPPHTR